MPDLTIEYYWLCESALGAGPWHIGTHKVEYGWQPQGRQYGPQYDYSCDCKGFQFRKQCKHIEEAKKIHCKWHQYMDGGEPLKRGKTRKCPRCKGPVTAERWAV